MSVHSNWPEARQPYGGGPEPPGRWGSRTVILLLALVAAVVLCLTGVLAASLLRSDDPPPTLPAFAGVTTAVPQVQGTVPAGTPGQPELEIQPNSGYVNTLITVTGVGWSPGEPVFIFLRTAQGDAAGNYAYAAAVADDRGSFRTALTFPNEARWSGQSAASVVARGSRSGLEAGDQFDLVMPTATSTVPLPTLPPTQPATATRPVTDTPPPTATATPTSTPLPVITDWLGEYFAGRDLAGTPLLARNDTSIDFNWGLGSPAAGVPVDEFSARWTRQLNFREANYRFTVWSDDGIRLWLDGELLIDQWRDGVVEGFAVDRFLPGGTHSLRVEYYENTG
ncbi:MAG TPA: PA14 domain-containing protein, partial [Anaerolineae bacterium]|nr:PA14 domain-containing protein [Anaerolineae bacterium]